MNRILLSFCTVAIFTGASFAQTSAQAQASGSAAQSSSLSANQSGAQADSHTGAQAATEGALANHSGKQSTQAAASNQLATGSTIHASLEKPIDARKCKPGDEVVAKTTQNVKSNGKVVVPKGSKIVGHVTQAQARTKGESESSLGIAFDHAILRDGRQVPLTASIQAIGSSAQSASAAMDDADMMAGGSAMASGGGTAAPSGGLVGGGHLVGGVAAPVAGTVNNVSAGAGQTLHGAGSATSAAGALSSNSHGVVGLNGLALNSLAANSTQGSLITSKNQNVHLDSGTQMILQVAGK